VYIKESLYLLFYTFDLTNITWSNNMYRFSVVTTFGFALSSISSSLIANDVSTLTAQVSILMTTLATITVLYFGE